MTSSIIKSSSWKHFFLDSTEFNYSNKLLSKIKEAGSAGNTAEKIFTGFSRNPGIGFLSLDASEENLQLFYHPTILGDSWMNEELKLVALIGLSNKATPIQIVPKSLKEVKVKGPTPQEIITSLSTTQPFENIKGSSTTFHYKNMIPIPDLLLKTFITLDQTDPKSVAQAFYEIMLNADNDHTDDKSNDMSDTDTESDSHNFLQGTIKEKTGRSRNKFPIIF
jgi:hypothetical protein